MTDDTDWTTLVPVEVLEGETVPDSLVELLGPLPVVVLGYHVLPEQTAPGQARMQFEDRAQAKLAEIADAFRAVGTTAETQLVFTHDEDQTIDRVADETDTAAVLLPNPAGDVERLFVPLGGSSDVDRIAAYVAALVDDRSIAVALTHVTGEAGADAGQAMLDDAAATFRAAGVPADAISTDVAVSDEPLRTIATLGADHDAVVMGENQPSLRSFLFGDSAERVAAASLGPVLVVRNEPEEQADGEAADEDDEAT